MEDLIMQSPVNLDTPSPDPGAEGDAPGIIDQATQRRYRIFKKNSPFLYDYMSTNSLLWPSLSVQFFPDLEVADANPPIGIGHDRSGAPSSDIASSAKTTGPSKAQSNSELAHQRLLLGTFTLGQAVDAIHLYQVPYYRNLNKCINTDHWTYNSEKEEFELPTIAKTKLRSLQSINHNGDVNKLRYMPQNPDIIASSNNVGDLCVYNRTKHSTIKKLGEESKVNEPQLRLVNSAYVQNADIFALDWNKQAESVLVSASMDGQINVFDIRGNYATRAGPDNSINQTWCTEHGVGVNDVEWIYKHDSIFLTADDAGGISVFDTRSSATALKAQIGPHPLNSLSVSPANDFCVSTGDSQGQIEIWDIRALHSSAKTISAHSDAITQVKWHPKFTSVLGSSSADRSVRIFDVADPQEPLLFSHEGHMLGVNDFDWSLHEDWMVASVGDDNSLHLWKPAHHVVKKVYT